MDRFLLGFASDAYLQQVLLQLGGTAGMGAMAWTHDSPSLRLVYVQVCSPCVCSFAWETPYSQSQANGSFARQELEAHDLKKFYDLLQGARHISTLIVKTLVSERARVFLAATKRVTCNRTTLSICFRRATWSRSFSPRSCAAAAFELHLALPLTLACTCTFSCEYRLCAKLHHKP